MSASAVHFTPFPRKPSLALILFSFPNISQYVLFCKPVTTANLNLLQLHTTLQTTDNQIAATMINLPTRIKLFSSLAYTTNVQITALGIEIKWLASQSFILERFFYLRSIYSPQEKRVKHISLQYTVERWAGYLDRISGFLVCNP